MGFDINETLAGMAEAAKGVLKNEWPLVKKALEDVLQKEQGMLNKIALARINEEISEDDMKRQLEDEKIAFNDGLLMIQVVSKKLLQDAVNAAIGAFWTAVKNALKAI